MPFRFDYDDRVTAGGRCAMRGGRCSFKKNRNGPLRSKNSKFKIRNRRDGTSGMRGTQKSPRLPHFIHKYSIWCKVCSCNTRMAAMAHAHGHGTCAHGLKKVPWLARPLFCGTLLFDHARTRGTKQHCSVSRESNIVVLFLFVTMHLDSG